MLVVVRERERRFRDSGAHWYAVPCRCDCGKEKDIDINILTRATNPSCGCQSRKGPPRKPPEVKKEAQRQWRIKNRAVRKMYIREWKRRNPDRIAEYGAARRMAMLMAWSEEDQKAVRAIYRLSRSEAVVPCCFCGCDTYKGGRHVDHKIALAKGGAHTADNLGIACEFCNLSKHTQSEAQFAAKV